MLRRAYLDGRLEVEEFAERAGLALQARTTGELRALVRDLPWLADALAGARALAFRAALLAVLAAAWVMASLALGVAFLAALLPGGMSAQEGLVFPLAWVLVTWVVWRRARR
jgi:hypothetical protein